jgi:hypothetical protein
VTTPQHHLVGDLSCQTSPQELRRLGEWKERHQRWAWVLSPEWAAEWMVHWSRDWNLVTALDLAGKFGIVVAVFFAEAHDSQKA